MRRGASNHKPKPCPSLPTSTDGRLKGVPVKVITERLGHEDPAFTMKQYAHVIPGMQADAARIVASSVKDAMPGPDEMSRTTQSMFDTSLT